MFLVNEKMFNCKKIRFLYYYRGDNFLKGCLEKAGYISIIKENQLLIGDMKEDILDFTFNE